MVIPAFDVRAWLNLIGPARPKNITRLLVNEVIKDKQHGGLWQYRLWSYQTGGTKLERFLPKNEHTQRLLLNFENWISGEV